MEQCNLGELQVLCIITGVLVKWQPEIVPREGCLPFALSPLKIMLGLSTGPQAMLQGVKVTH